MDNKKVVTNKNFLPFVLVTSMFFMWGLANNMTDTLLAAFKKIMSMSDFQTSWIQIAFYGSYFCLALPAAVLIRKYSYKTGILVGLGFFIVGSLLFYPASQTMIYGHFLTALFILAGGLSILETTANPYIIAMGDEKSSIRRLNLAQSFNPIGSITGVLLSKFFILDSLNAADSVTRAGLTQNELQEIQRYELNAVMGPYVGVAILLGILWLIIAITRMPESSEKGTGFDLISSISRLLKNRNYTSGVVAQFFYVGAQICVWSFTIRYIMLELQNSESEAANYYLAALILFTASRFAFTALLRKFSARTLLTASALMAIFFLFIVVFGGGIVGAVALIGISGCMSLMFPTIFGMALKGTGNDQKLAGSGLIMAILGGAVLTALQGYVSDTFGNLKLSFFVPVICFVIIAVYGFRSKTSGS